MLTGGNGKDILTGGSGEDVFYYDFSYQENGGWDEHDTHYVEANDLISDFRPGEDRLSISYHHYTQTGEPFEIKTTFAAFVSLYQLDTNGDDVVGVGNKGISVRSASFMGETRQSLVIDTGNLGHINDQTFSQGTITLFSVTSVGIWDG